ncbi:diguanylate cyclase [Pararhodospirillum photometricum]|nr:diguanylate cyclase [Pararhodospirillum photometricum]
MKSTDVYSDPARERLDATVRSFIETAQGQGEELVSLAAAFVDGAREEVEGRQRLRFLAHRLAGSAGSLGYCALGRTAAALERLILVLPETQVDRDTLDQLEYLAYLVNEEIRALDPEASLLHAPLLRRSFLAPGKSGPAPVVLTLGVERALSLALEEAGFEALVWDEERSLQALPLTPLAGGVVELGTAPDRELEQALGGLRAAGIPVVAIGGAGTFLWRVRAYRLGANAYLPHAEAGECVEALLRLMAEASLEPWRVLVIADTPLVAGFVGGVLDEAGIQCEILGHPEEVLGRLVAFEPDVLVVDVGMRSYSAAEVAAVVRDAAPQAVPIVAVSHRRDASAQQAALAAGVDLLLSWPLHPEVVVAAIEAQGRRGRLARENQRHEPPTGLLTNDALQEHLQREVARARRAGTPLSMAVFDPDRLRSLLTQHGHQVGDQLVRFLAQTLRRRLRGSDAAGRCCGTAVAAILPGATVGQAASVIGSLLEEIHGKSLSTPEGPVSITVSAGVAELADPREGVVDPAVAMRDLLERVEQALAQARAEGGGRMIVAPPL